MTSIFFLNEKKIELFFMDSEKSINVFEINKDRLPDYLLSNFFLPIR